MSFKKNKDSKNIDEDIDIPEYTNEEIKENFPSLYGELSGEVTTKLSSSDMKEILSDNAEEEINILDDRNSEISAEPEVKIVTKTAPMEKDYLRGFDPKAIDFIRRAKTNEEALEVLNYLEQRGEIPKDECESLKAQLRELGLESFGEHKEDGYYFEYQRKKHLEEKMRLSGKQPVK